MRVCLDVYDCLLPLHSQMGQLISTKFRLDLAELPPLLQFFCFDIIKYFFISNISFLYICL